MNNVEILEKYEEKRRELWNTKHALEIRLMRAFDSLLNQEYEVFICSIANYKDTVCLYNVNDEYDFSMITYNKFNLSRFTILNDKELLAII